jgi:hypothetical protein
MTQVALENDFVKCLFIIVHALVRQQTRIRSSSLPLTVFRIRDIPGVCDFDWSRTNGPRRNMLLGNNLRKSSKNDRGFASGLKRVRFTQLYQLRQTLFDCGVKYSSRRWCNALSPAFFVFPKGFSLVFTRVNARWAYLSQI